MAVVANFLGYSFSELLRAVVFPGSYGEGMSASVGNALLLVGAPVALMEELQTIVLPENTHNTTTSGLFKKI